MAPLAAISIGALSKALKRANRRAMEEMSQIYSTLDETLQGIKVVKAFTMERHERHRFHENSKKYYRKSMKIARYDSLTRPLVEILGLATIVVGVLAGAYLGIKQQCFLFGIRMSERPLEIQDLMVFFGLLAGASEPARKLSEVFSRLQRASAAAERIYQLIDREPSVVDPPQSRPLPRHHRDLAFEGLHFHYYPTQPVLQDINLRIKFGETIAIVGPNGCGKTTLANLLPRFYDPIRGSVKIDGVDLREARLADIRSQIGLVTQETLLFDDTVFNNIRYGSPHATRAEVVAAAQQAHAQFIETKLGQGYETIVGPRQPAFWRTTAANCPGPGDPARSQHSDSRRSHESDRSGKRTTDPQSARAIHPQPHDRDHHAPDGAPWPWQIASWSCREGGFSTSALTTSSSAARSCMAVSTACNSRTRREPRTLTARSFHREFGGYFANWHTVCLETIPCVVAVSRFQAIEEARSRGIAARGRL